jgi:hypothetical protein
MASSWLAGSRVTRSCAWLASGPPIADLLRARVPSCLTRERDFLEHAVHMVTEPAAKVGLRGAPMWRSTTRADALKPSPGSAEQRWWSRHVWITVTVCGLLGASIFFAVVRSMMSDEPLGCCLALFVAGLPGVGLIPSTMAALLLGVRARMLLIRLGRSGGIDSPRCGTFNERHSAACSACSLPLAS